MRLYKNIEVWKTHLLQVKKWHRHGWNCPHCNIWITNKKYPFLPVPAGHPGAWLLECSHSLSSSSCCALDALRCAASAHLLLQSWWLELCTPLLHVGGVEGHWEGGLCSAEPPTCACLCVIGICISNLPIWKIFFFVWHPCCLECLSHCCPVFKCLCK